MALADEARRVAAEFTFTPDDVRRSTKEFIRQMGKSTFLASLARIANRRLQRRASRRTAPT